MIAIDKKTGIHHLVRQYYLSPDNIQVVKCDTWAGTHIVGSDCTLILENCFDQKTVDAMIDYYAQKG